MKPYYEEDGIALYHGNSLDLLSSIATPDHIVTDPPYSEATKAGALTRDDSTAIGGAEFVPFAIHEASLRTILELKPPSRWTVMFCDWRHAASVLQTPPQGYKSVRFGIWNKPDGAPQFTGDRPAPGWEAVAILHSINQKLRWNGGGSRSVWTFEVERQNGHPTPKPLPLILRMITLFTDADETILDPFTGSGTTLLAAKRLGRKAIGIELAERYCEVAALRLSQQQFEFQPDPIPHEPERTTHRDFP